MHRGAWTLDDVLAPPEDSETGQRVELVGEVISPTGCAQDKVLKRDLYAKAGVPFYLLVDPEPKPVGTTLLALDGDEYREAAVGVDGVLTVTEPFPVRLDLLT